MIPHPWQHLDQVPPKKQNDTRKSVLAYLQHRFPEVEKIFLCGGGAGGGVGGAEEPVLNLLRYLHRTRPKGIHWRDMHPYMVAEHLHFHFDHPSTITGTTTTTGQLVVEGVQRGMALNVDRLVHLPLIGDFQLAKVEVLAPATTHHHLTTVKKSTPPPPPTPPASDNMEVDSLLLSSSLSSPSSSTSWAASVVVERTVTVGMDRSSIIHEIVPDPMEGEQTWPTEEELLEAEERVRKQKSQRKTKMVPKGTSSYQAAWIVDDEDLGSDDGELDEDEEANKDTAMMVEEDHADDDDLSDLEEVLEDGQAHGAHDDDDGYYDDDEDDDRMSEHALEAAMQAELEKQAERKNRSAHDAFLEDLEYPDEVDTPLDTAARVRFQKYRGLRSFRNADWDPYENLPRDYARIFQFDDFMLTKKRVLTKVEQETLVGGESCVAVGRRVRLYLKDVPLLKVMELYQTSVVVAPGGGAGNTENARVARRPLALFGLLPHEEKMSVVNFTCTRLKREEWYGDGDGNGDQEAAAYLQNMPIIRFKDTILVQCGFRRYVNRPVYSQHSRGPLFKYERYLVPGRPTVGTMFAPIAFPPTPTLLFQPGHEYPVLVGRGSVLSVDPNRLVIKRIILTGDPTKLNKSSRHSLNTAVIRYMFFDPDDIHYFRPIELRTKEGKRGHILDSIGTHGAMKCSFDRPLQQSDTIQMMLYKRVYPRWPAGGFEAISRGVPSILGGHDDGDDEEEERVSSVAMA